MWLDKWAFAIRHLYVYPKLQIGYTYIPKNACTSFKRTFGEAQGWLQADAASAHAMKTSWWLSGLLHHHSVNERIVVLRDPWDRLLSGYQNRFLMRHDDVSQHAMDTGLAGLAGKGSARNEISFELFLNYCRKHRTGRSTSIGARRATSWLASTRASCASNTLRRIVHFSLAVASCCRLGRDTRRPRCGEI